MAEKFGEENGEDEELNKETQPNATPEELAELIEGKKAETKELEKQRAATAGARDKLLQAKKTNKSEVDKLKIHEKMLAAKLRTAAMELEELEAKLALFSVKGRLRLLSQDGEAISELRQKWIDAQIAHKLAYPVFMATSELGERIPLVITSLARTQRAR